MSEAWQAFLEDEDAKDWQWPRTPEAFIAAIGGVKPALEFMSSSGVENMPPILKHELIQTLGLKWNENQPRGEDGRFLADENARMDREWATLTPEQQDIYNKLITQATGYSHDTAMHVAKLAPGLRAKYAERWSAGSPAQEHALNNLARAEGLGGHHAGGDWSPDTIHTSLPLAPKGVQDQLTDELRARHEAGTLKAVETDIPMSKLMATEKYISRNAVAAAIRGIDEGPGGPHHREGYIPIVVKKGGNYYVYDGNTRSEASTQLGHTHARVALFDLDSV